MSASGKPRGRRVRVERGIYRDAHGYSVIARLGSGAHMRRSKEQRFPLTTPLATMLAHWRELKATLAMPAAPGFTADEAAALRVILNGISASVEQARALIAERVS
jgi:hypothetical protein